MNHAKKRGDKGEFWWELRACAYYEEFYKPKIFYPDITDSSKFHYEVNGAYSSNTSYFLPIDLEGLAGYLNSKLIWFLLTGLCDSVRGGFYRMFSQNINELPIPDSLEINLPRISKVESSLQGMAREKFISESVFRRRLVDLVPEQGVFKLNKKLDSWWVLGFSELQKEIKKSFKGVIPLAERNDWQDYFELEQRKREDIQREITLLEAQLNQEVYKLFDLTDDEIALIENDL